MLPSTDAVLAAWPFLSRRFEIESTPSRAQVEAALELASNCAESEAEEPAAIFFAFARHPRAIPGAWRMLGERFARVHASRAGFDLDATAEELTPIRLGAATGRFDWPDVRAWFRARLKAL